MKETPEQLRERAARIRQMAQYAEGSAYHREMQQAQHLLARAEELETANSKLDNRIEVGCAEERSASIAPQKQPRSENRRRTGNRSCVSGTPAVPGHRTENRRRKDLAKIHLLKKDAGLDDDSYRDLLQQLTGKRSAGQLTGPERYKVIGYLRRQSGRKHYPGRPNTTDNNPQLRKIEALLAEAKRPWEYARAIAERMHGKKRLEWCSGDELTGVITALIKDAARHGRTGNRSCVSSTPTIPGGRRTDK